MSYTNTAAWLDFVGAKLRVGPAEIYKPGKDEVLVEVHATAINPVDWAQANMGLFIEKTPVIVGIDISGIVIEAGEEVTHVSKGSRILGATRISAGSQVLPQLTEAQSQAQAAFQKYAIIPAVSVCSIPDNMPFTEGAVIPLAFLTAAAGLFQKEFLGLPPPSLNPTRAGKSILIWGGASSVGCNAIQLAAAAGLDVITTSSPRNFELCKSLGANEVLDYNSSTAIQDIQASLKGKAVIGVYEASGSDEAVSASVDIMSSLGGGVVAVVRPINREYPSNVAVKFFHAGEHAFHEPAGAKHLWQEFLPAALASGQFKSAPPAEVVGKGLEAIQEGLNAWKRGVSAKKVVIEL